MSDAFVKRWMLFVDGENFTIQAQNLVRGKQQAFPTDKSYPYRRDAFVWLLNVFPTKNIIPLSTVHLQQFAIRAHYYTTSDSGGRDELARFIRELGFTPRVFTKNSKSRKSKGVDIALTTDMLVHAFFDNYDAAVLIAGDGDYVPLVEEVKRLGKNVYLMFFRSGLGPALHLSADHFVDIEPLFMQHWLRSLTGHED